MYLDKNDVMNLKDMLEQVAVFEDNLYLIYRDKEGEMALASGEDEIFRYKEKGDG